MGLRRRKWRVWQELEDGAAAGRGARIGGCSMGGRARLAKYRRRWDLEQFGLPVRV